MPYLLLSACVLAAGPDLTVTTNFPGGSAEVESINSTTRTVSIRPTAHADRGWTCWWSFRLDGIQPGETLTLNVTGGGFARPDRAFFSLDNTSWSTTPVGQTKDQTITYRLTIPAATKESVYVAWGPPYLLAHAQAAVTRAEAANCGAKSFVLCKSRDGRDVPAVRWQSAITKETPSLWIQARQHAWETGGSWVAQGVLDFLTSDDAAAKTLRESAHLVVVPIMDLDNVERGAGGKEGKPHDHNRDWSDQPHWPEVATAQRAILEMDKNSRFVLFLDLHNPAPNDKLPFFFGPPDELMPAVRQASQERFYQLASDRLNREALRLSPRQRVSGANYDRRWRTISKNWVAAHTQDGSVSLTLETSWNTPHSIVDGYRAYGRALGRVIADYVRVVVPGPP